MSEVESLSLGMQVLVYTKIKVLGRGLWENRRRKKKEFNQPFLEVIGIHTSKLNLRNNPWNKIKPITLFAPVISTWLYNFQSRFHGLLFPFNWHEAIIGKFSEGNIGPELGRIRYLSILSHGSSLSDFRQVCCPTHLPGLQVDFV